MPDQAITTVGVVRCERDKPAYGGWLALVSQIHVDPAYERGLDGIDDYSHVIVVYLLDRIGEPTLTIRPQGKPDVPEVGIFACRCPARPSPIGMTTCRLVAREGNVIRVEGLDALDGTPVLDLKPYWPQYDAVDAAKCPDWVDQLDF